MREFMWAVVKEPTGREEEPPELIYFKGARPRSFLLELAQLAFRRVCLLPRDEPTSTRTSDDHHRRRVDQRFILTTLLE
jgi:hypothetical protein